MTRPVVSIIGSALTGNMGAVAMLESTLSSLRRDLPGARFVLFSVYPAEDRRANRHPDLEIVPAAPRQLGVTINLLALVYRCLPVLRPTLRRRSRAIEALTASAVLLDQGGITFSDGREKYLLYNIASVLPALLVRTPVVKCAQAIGPFEGRLNRLAARAVLPRMRRIYTRGRLTHDFAVGLGLTNAERSADLAFTLEPSGDEAERVGASLDLGVFEREQVVGVAPSAVIARKIDAAGAPRYVGDTAELIGTLLRAGRTVAIVPHSARRGTEKAHNNDLPLCREIAAAVGAHPRLLLVDQDLGSEELRYVIGRCSVFVASRFHAMVSALAMGVPTLVIGWSHKYREVLEMFDLESWAMSHTEYAVPTVLARLAELEDESAVVRARLAEHLPQVVALARRQLTAIADLAAGDPR